MGPRIAPWRRADSVDLGLALLLAAAALIEARQPGRTYSHPAVMTTCALLMTLPLTLRRRVPVPVALFVALVAMIEAVTVRVPASAVLFLAALVAIYTVVTICARRMWLVVILVGLVAATVTEIRDPATRSVFEALPSFAVIAAVVLLALVVRRSREQSARLSLLAAELANSRAEAEDLAKAGERLRIARDMHDVLAHSVSVMVLQTGAARMALHENEPRIRELLVGIEGVGRDALEELRTILGVLREDRTVAAPGHRVQLDKVVETIRAAGLSVDVDVDVAVELEDLAEPVAVALVRVVQEGLTNALKHSTAAMATVRIGRNGADLQVVISNVDAPADVPAPSLPTGGHGLLGVAERVVMIGGTVQAGPLTGGGWQLEATIPLIVAPADVAVAS